MFESTSRGLKSEVAFSASALLVEGDSRTPRVGHATIEPEREQRRSLFDIGPERSHAGQATALFIADTGNSRVKLVIFDANDDKIHVGTVYTCAPGRQLGAIELVSERGYLALVECASSEAKRRQELVLLAPSGESLADLTDQVRVSRTLLCSILLYSTVQYE